MKHGLLSACVFACVLPCAVCAETPNPAAVEVPYRLADTKHILVRAKINGAGPFTFVLDTGSPALLINKTVGDKIGLWPERDGWIDLQRFELEGGLVVPKARGRIETVAPVEAINGMGLAGTEVHGLLGYNILAKYRVQLDLTRDKLNFTPLDFQPEPPRMGKGGLPASINALGAVIKVFGVLLGRRSSVALKPRGFLGFEIEDNENDVLVKSVLPQGPAGAAGLVAGDKITHCQDKQLKKPSDLFWQLSTIKPGEPVRLKVQRKDAVKEFSIQAGEGL